MSPLEFVHLLGNWSGGDGPVYEKLARAIGNALERGEIPAETRLPAERTLARLLRLSRTTVVSAYEQLRQRGWVERRQGSGTRVRGPLSPGARKGEEPALSFRSSPCATLRGDPEGVSHGQPAHRTHHTQH